MPSRPASSLSERTSNANGIMVVNRSSSPAKVTLPSICAVQVEGHLSKLPRVPVLQIIIFQAEGPDSNSQERRPSHVMSPGTVRIPQLAFILSFSQFCCNELGPTSKYYTLGSTTRRHQQDQVQATSSDSNLSSSRCTHPSHSQHHPVIPSTGRTVP